MVKLKHKNIIMKYKNQKSAELIAILNECAATCRFCSVTSLNEETVKSMVSSIKSNLDCSEMCNLLASYLSRNSAHASHLLKECIEICEACATECEKHPHMDHCRECAETCRKCAEACKNAL